HCGHVNEDRRDSRSRLLASIETSQTRQLEGARDTCAPLTFRMRPVPNRAAKLRERRFQARDFAAARWALRDMVGFLPRDVANQTFRHLISCQVLIYLPCSSPSLSDCTARKRCVLTVPSFIPVTAAISKRSMSSTNRSRKTVRCRSDNLPAAFQIVSTCSFARASASGDLCLSGIQSLMSFRSTPDRSLRFQNFNRLLAS